MEITTVGVFFLFFSDGDVFSEDPSRQIVSLNFESLLDGKIFSSSLKVTALIICSWEDIYKFVVYLLMHYYRAFKRFLARCFSSCVTEEKAPPSSRLVQRLIFQFIESQGCWQEKCPTLYYLPQVMFQESL